ncbi:hypothetical protein BKA59DRAFT_490108 [Fusarium tricinctum]|uniref:Uncharacterized protein n=1 Tax=Fusarium tricinctum TaxID=61284 RepID=A0A8K0SFS7_9HYPO|nr:hypothetical protein BKA59DRAFT_490108 [Fusarium tricinctum]
MQSILPIFLLFTNTLAAKVQVVWRLEKDTNASSLSVYDSKRSLIAETCGSILHARDTIDFSDVNEAGFGNFTVGDASYLVHSKADWSGGPECSRVFNPGYALVQCSGVDWDPKDLVESDATKCFEGSQTNGELQSLQKRSEPQDSELEARQFQCSSWITRTDLVGNGDPHQNYFHKQLSETINCGNAQSCSVGQSQTESFSIGFTLSAGGGGDNWISGGFSVTKSWTTGNSYTCSGGPGETICIWYNIAHTAYTVQDITSNPCTGSKTSSPYIMFSPNQNNVGGGYYCVVGTCRAKGDGYWDYSGRAGGP